MAPDGGKSRRQLLLKMPESCIGSKGFLSPYSFFAARETKTCSTSSEPAFIALIFALSIFLAQRQRRLTFSRLVRLSEPELLPFVQEDVVNSVALARFLRPFPRCGGSVSSPAPGADGPLPGVVRLLRQNPGRLWESLWGGVWLPLTHYQGGRWAQFRWRQLRALTGLKQNQKHQKC